MGRAPGAGESLKGRHEVELASHQHRQVEGMRAEMEEKTRRAICCGRAGKV